MSSGITFEHECVIIDACCVINLFATDCMEDILKAAPVRFAVSSFVKEREALGVFVGVDVDGNPKRAPIDLLPLIHAGVLDVIVPNWAVLSPHIVVFAKAGIRGMGEKISGAIAHDKNWAIATDDRDAQRKIARLMPNNQIVTTLELVWHWAMMENVSDDVLRDVLRKIRIRGKAELAKDHPLYNWAIKYILAS